MATSKAKPKGQNTSEKRKRGRPDGTHKVPVNAQLLAQVEKLKGIGMSNVEVARIIGVSETTFQAMIKNSTELFDATKRGSAKAHAMVAETAFKMATSGKSAPMTQFWLKARAGWKEQVEVKVDSKHTVVFETQVVGGSLRQSSKEIATADQTALDNIIDGLIVDEAEDEETPDE